MLLPHLLHSIIDPTWKVLFITTNKQKFNRADFVISKHEFLDRTQNGAWLKESPERFTEKSWIKVDDYCNPKHFSKFKNNKFDLVVCDQVLENIRDPQLLCKEMQRVGKRGYIEHVSPIMEFVKNVDRANVVGYPYHRWLITNNKNANKIEIHFKNHLIHSMNEFHINLVQNIPAINPIKMFKFLFWENSIKIEENCESADFPDWLFEEIYDDFKKTDKNIFYNLEQPVPMMLEETPFKKDQIVDLLNVKIKFAIPILQNGKPNNDLFKFESMLKQQGKL